MLKSGTLTLSVNVEEVENDDSVQCILDTFATKHGDTIKETFGVKDTNMVSFGMGSHWLYALGFTIAIVGKEDQFTLTLTKP